MRKFDVRTPEDALSYILDCNLATVSSMAAKNSRPKAEFRRQISIAQSGYSWCIDMGVDITGNRAEEIRDQFNGSVESWAEQYIDD